MYSLDSLNDCHMDKLSKESAKLRLQADNLSTVGSKNGWNGGYLCQISKLP